MQNKFNPIKSPREIESMKHAGDISAKALIATLDFLQVGKTTLEVDTFAREFIASMGGESGFMKVPGYKHTCCICINEQVVHTPPSDQVIKDGDMVCVDLGAYYGGLHTDVAATKVVGNSNANKDRFLQVGYDTLEGAIKLAHSGVKISEVSAYINQKITKAGYFVFPELTGHGVGKELHEWPNVPQVVTKESNKIVFEPGMTIAIEIIYSSQKSDLKYENNDHWSLVAKKNSLTACFEKTILITDTKSLVITNYVWYNTKTVNDK